MFSIPPLFQLIQQESGTSWKEMYKVFNMGHRYEIYCQPNVAEKIIYISKSLAGIKWQKPKKPEILFIIKFHFDNMKSRKQINVFACFQILS